MFKYIADQYSQFKVEAEVVGGFTANPFTFIVAFIRGLRYPVE